MPLKAGGGGALTPGPSAAENKWSPRRVAGGEPFDLSSTFLPVLSTPQLPASVCGLSSVLDLRCSSALQLLNAKYILKKWHRKKKKKASAKRPAWRTRVGQSPPQ